MVRRRTFLSTLTLYMSTLRANPSIPTSKSESEFDTGRQSSEVTPTPVPLNTCARTFHKLLLALSFPRAGDATATADVQGFVKTERDKSSKVAWCYLFLAVGIEIVATTLLKGEEVNGRTTQGSDSSDPEGRGSLSERQPSNPHPLCSQPNHVQRQLEPLQARFGSHQRFDR